MANAIKFYYETGNAYAQSLCLTLKDDPTDNKRTEKMKDKMPTLMQNQKSCIPTLKANAMQHICFCPNAPCDNKYAWTE